MQTKLTSSIAIVLCSLFFSAAFSEEMPRVGLLYNTKENHSLTYDCKLRKEILNCDFVQVYVLKKNQKDTKEFLSDAKNEFLEEIKKPKESCSEMEDVVDMLEGKKVAPKEVDLTNMPDFQKTDLLNGVRAFIKFCKSRNEKDYIEIGNIMRDRESRTCYIGSRTFHQNFKKMEDNSSVGVWVAQGDAHGDCGIVPLSRFESEASSGIIFWKYISRKAVTNPRGSSILFPCNKIDEKEYIYDWKKNERALRCDYIVFSP